MNAIFGFSGGASGPYPFYPLAASITQQGSNMIKDCVQYIEEEWPTHEGNKPLRVVYGDTDSVMMTFVSVCVCVPGVTFELTASTRAQVEEGITVEEARLAFAKLEMELTLLFPRPVEMEYEMLVVRMLRKGPKMYVKLHIPDTPEAARAWDAGDFSDAAIVSRCVRGMGFCPAPVTYTHTHTHTGDQGHPNCAEGQGALGKWGGVSVSRRVVGALTWDSGASCSLQGHRVLYVCDDGARGAQRHARRAGGSVVGLGGGQVRGPRVQVDRVHPARQGVLARAPHLQEACVSGACGAWRSSETLSLSPIIGTHPTRCRPSGRRRSTCPGRGSSPASAWV